MQVFEKSDLKKGFTLVEVLIALVIAGIIMVAAYSLYLTFSEQSTAQDLVIEAQQNARAGLELIQKDLILVGHRVPSGIDPIASATSSKFEFRYVDPDAATVDNRIKVVYDIHEDSGAYALRKQKCVQENDNWNSCKPGTDSYYDVIENLDGATGLVFKYYDEDGDEFTPVAGTGPGSVAAVRFVKVIIRTKTKSALPTTGEFKTFELRTEVRLRNLDIESSSADTDAPLAPTGLKVREASIGGRDGICGRLRLRWDKGTEEDLAGYKIFYSKDSGETWSKTVSLSGLESDGAYYYYTLVAATGSNKLEACESDGTPSIKYTFSIRAYDSAPNYSDSSADVIGADAVSRITDFNADEDDTAINPSKPAAVTNFKAQDGDADNQVKLTWDYDTTNNPDVTGFRIFRSTTPFTTFPIEANTTTILQVASETTVTSSATSFTDTGLIGCQDYYYAIAAINCDTTLYNVGTGVEDGDNTKYVVTDYAGTCGDGSGTSCTPGTGFPPVADSDAHPLDSTPPGPPVISGRAGWRRVAVTFTNPTTGDFAKSCLYVEKGGTSGAPVLSSDKDANGCFNVSNYVEGERGLVPDASPDSNPNGVFTNTNPVTFWHDSMTLRNPAEPTLAEAGNEVQTYSYRAVAYDKCGNPVTLAQATSATAMATTNLCGEDPTGKPPAPGLSASPVSGCTEATISWTPIMSDINQASSATNPWDLAGYRILKSSTTDFSSAELMNPTAPYWCEGSCSYPDSAVSEGSTYYYKVASTDCPYEMTNPSADTIRSNMNSGVISSADVIGPVTPGQIGRDEKCSGASSCEKDLHREVLSGVTLDADNNSTPSATFTHNTVTMFIENTSAGNMTVQGASARWVNSSVYLRNISIGGGRSGLAVISNEIPQSATGSVSDTPYTMRVSNFDFGTDAVITGSKRYVPITLEFRDSADGTDVDMREDQIQITLNVMNDSTGTTTCISYATITGSADGIVVSGGPSINSVQQTNPVSNTFAVPGAGGANTVPTDGSYAEIQLPATVDVTVVSSIESRTVDGNSGNKVDISNVKLYWVETLQDVGDAPATGWTQVDMVNTTGNSWSGDIQQTGNYFRRIWYYIVVEDSDGNYDRSPPINEGYYTFDRIADPCEDTPETTTASLTNSKTIDIVGTYTAPGITVTGSGASGSVSISWTEVTKNTDDSDIWDLAGYKVYVASSTDKGLIWSDWSLVPDGTVSKEITSFSYVPTDADGAWLKYYVTPYDLCSTPIENQGESLGPVIKKTCSAAPATATLTIANGGSYNNSYDRNDGSVGLSWNANAESDFESYSIYASTDGGATWGSSIYTTTDSSVTTYSATTSASENTTVKYKIVTEDKCDILATSSSVSITKSCSVTPNAPTGLTNAYGSDVKTSNPNKGTALLSWSASSSNDLASYNVYQSTDGGTTWGAAVNKTTTSHTSGDLSSYTKVTFGVTTVDKCGLESSKTTINVYPGTCSSSVTASTLSVANTSVNASYNNSYDMPDGSVKLNWTQNTNADFKSYQLYVSTDGGSTWNTVGSAITTAGTTTYTHTPSATQGTVVRYKLVTTDQCSAIATSNIVSITKACSSRPATPSNFVTTNSPASQDKNGAITGVVVLTWSNNTENDLVGYHLWESKNGILPPTNIQTIAVGTTTATVTLSGTDGTTYDYVLTAYDSCPIAGYTDSSGATISTITKICADPPTASTLSVNNAPQSNSYDKTDGSVTLSWTANADADFASYQLYVSTDGGTTWNTAGSAITSAATTSAPHTPAASQGTVVSYKLVTSDKCGNTATSGTVSITKSCSANPTASTLSVNNAPQSNSYDKTDGSVTLSWTQNNEADFASYQLYVSTDGGTTWNTAGSAITSAATTSASHTPAASQGTVVSYKLVTTDLCGKTATSGTVSITKSCSANPTASTLSVNNAPQSNSYDKTDGSVTLSWTANADADFVSYQLYVSTDGGTTWNTAGSAITSAATTSASHTPGVAQGTVVRYRLVTTDLCGKTATSGTVSITKSCSVTPTAPQMSYTCCSGGDGDDLYRIITLPSGTPGDLSTLNIYYCPSPYSGVGAGSTDYQCGSGSVLIGTQSVPAGGGSYTVNFPLPDADAPTATSGAWFAVTVTDACGNTSGISDSY